MCNKMKGEYEPVQMEIVIFPDADIITTSDLSGIGTGTDPEVPWGDIVGGN